MSPIPERRVDETEGKLLALYALDRLGTSTGQQLLQIMADNDIMNYFDLQLILGDLCASGQAARTPHPADCMYELTDAGREALAMFMRRLPNSRMEQIRDSAVAMGVRFQREKQLVARSEQAPGGEYTLTLQVVEERAPVLSLRLSLPTNEMAQRFLKSWESKAGDIYGYIYRTLGEGAQD
jgi:hypothetical protein